MNPKTKLKQTEIGMIPEEWEEKEFSEIMIGGPRHGIYKPKSFFGAGVQIVKMGTHSDNEFIDSSMIPDRIEITQEELNRFKINEGDLLFLRTSLVLEGTGKCSYVRKLIEPAVFVSNLIAVSMDSKVSSPLFYFYYFKSPQGRQRILSLCEQTAAATIRGSDLKQLSVPFPPLPEQRAIAKILSDLDSKIELNQQMNKTLEAIGQAIFKRWFVDFEFPDEKGRPYKSSGGEMVYNEELGKEVPKGWNLLKLEDVVAKKKFAIVDGPFGTQLHSDEYVEEGIPVIRVINLSFDGKFNRDQIVHITAEKFQSLIRSAIYPDDILLAKTGATIGKLARCPSYIKKGLVASSVMKISPDSQRFNKHFLFNFIKMLSKQNYWESISSGSTRPTINIPDVKNVKLIYPPDNLMKKFNELMDALYSKIEISEQENFYLSQLRDSLLPKLMSGKIRVPVEDRA